MNKIEEYNENVSEGNTSNSDNVNDNGKRNKSRSTKKDLYNKEREMIINEINGMIGLDKGNHVILYDLEHNEELKRRLNELVPEIKKYYKCGNWGYFSTDEKKGMGNEIGLLKALYKNEDYEITSKRKMCIRDSIKKLQVELYFNKK